MPEAVLESSTPAIPDGTLFLGRPGGIFCSAQTNRAVERNWLMQMTKASGAYFLMPAPTAPITLRLDAHVRFVAASCPACAADARGLTMQTSAPSMADCNHWRRSMAWRQSPRTGVDLAGRLYSSPLPYCGRCPRQCRTGRRSPSSFQPGQYGPALRRSFPNQSREANLVGSNHIQLYILRGVVVLEEASSRGLAPIFEAVFRIDLITENWQLKNFQIPVFFRSVRF